MSVTAAQMDWMRHGIQVLRARVLAPQGLTNLQLRRMKWELGAREGVLKRLARREALTAAQEIVLEEMLTMADLHIEWYAGRIEEYEFIEGCRQARELLWLRLLAMWRDGDVPERQPSTEATALAAQEAAGADATGGSDGAEHKNPMAVAGREGDHAAASPAL